MNTLITFGHDQFGEVYLDCHLHIPPKEALNAAKLVEEITGHNPYEPILTALYVVTLRSRFQNTRAIILPGKWTRDEAEVFIKSTPRKRLNELSFHLPATL